MLKNPKKLLKWLILTDKIFILLKELRNVNEVFRKDKTLDYIKSHKKTGLHHLSGKNIFWKNHREGQLTRNFLRIETKWVLLSSMLAVNEKSDETAKNYLVYQTTKRIYKECRRRPFVSFLFYMYSLGFSKKQINFVPTFQAKYFFLKKSW